MLRYSFDKSELWYDRLNSQQSLRKLERLSVTIAVVGFFIHLLMIAWNKNLPIYFPFLGSLISKNYLAAIYTPFSVLLYYEVYILIVAIPKSLTKAVGKQFEIIALVVIRDVFKDLAYLGDNTFDLENIEILYPVFIDMTGGLAMFLLVGVFYHLNPDRAGKPDNPELKRFVQLKKGIALFLVTILLILSGYQLTEWIQYIAQAEDIAEAKRQGSSFFTQLFTVMIFADILILIVSFLYSDSFELTFRNAGYVISTLLIRFGLSVEKPYDMLFFLTSFIFGVLVLLIYRYFVYFQRKAS
jgi:hypothetical protein